MKPVWFLDIDGVINSWPRPPKETPWEFQFKMIAGYPIFWAREVVDFINRVHGDLIEIQWLTTWEMLANEEFAPNVGITHRFDVQPRTYLGADRWWKQERIEMFRKDNPNTPIIWTDDDIIYYMDLGNAQMLAGENSLVINPWSDEGLTEEHLLSIERFVS